MSRYCKAMDVLNYKKVQHTYIQYTNEQNCDYNHYANMSNNMVIALNLIALCTCRMLP